MVMVTYAANPQHTQQTPNTNTKPPRQLGASRVLASLGTLRSLHRTAQSAQRSFCAQRASFRRGLESSGGSGVTSPRGSSPLDEYFHAEANLLAKVVQLVTSYRRWGHLLARTDPLGLSNSTDAPASLTLESYDFTPAQLSSEKPLDVSKAVVDARGFTASDRSLPLRRLYARLRDVYAGSVGVEYMHIKGQEERGWLRDRLETVNLPAASVDEKLHALTHLCWAHSFAEFCASNFRTTKRFGLEGCESLVVGMDDMVVRAGELGVEYVVLGMAHRGRLNVLANVARKPLVQIFRDFRGVIQGSPVDNSEWRARTEVTFEQFDGDRDGRLSVEELHPALLRLGVPASVGDAANLVQEWATDPLGVSFEEFHALTKGLLFPRSNSGDVKYHLGMVQKRELSQGGSLELEVLPNPSHLEAVNPLVAGRARAVQLQLGGETERRRCLPLVVHGDAAFAGQGVVYETLGLSHLDGYSCGGTVHVIINNQIGFTTPPSQARSSRYCTDVAKVVEAPIFHVNGDDVEAVIRVCRLAVEYRQRFGRDAVVDLVCYRKNGHQEADNPSFTQPLMYAKIKQQPSTFAQYAAALVTQGVTSASAIEEMRKRIRVVLEKACDESRAATPVDVATRSSESSEPTPPPPEDMGDARDDATGVDLEALREAGREISTLPAELQAHRVVRVVYEQRAAMIEKGEAVDWAMAEALACATLLADGVHVRISGQDTERGTFSHRHAVVHDQQREGHTFCPLHQVAARYGTSFEIHNSPLSEFAVLGYELGHSLNSPHSLVVWEAQFGDFANTAQCIIDQFLCAGEAKWQVTSGLVLLLPHGMEGAGPEHSSARLERYLQLCDDDERLIPTLTSERALRRSRRTAANMLVVNLTTPANYFHVLRRQHAHPTLRKPLVIMAPKGLLRDKKLASPLEDFSPGRVFEPVIGDPRPDLLPPPHEVRKLIFCSGRVYFDLAAAREARGAYDVSLVRIEQLSPFPYQEVRDEIARLPNAIVAWAQEDAMNYGAWNYVRHRLENTVRSLSGLNHPVPYIGRSPSAAPATGLVELHKQEVDELLEVAFR